jgi:hypothetical protein
MSSKWSGLANLAIFLGVTVLVMSLWLGGLHLLSLFKVDLVGSSDVWAMVEALSVALTAAAAFGAGFIAYRELSELSSSRHLEVAGRLFEELNSLENIDARRWVFQHLPQDPKEGLMTMTPEGRAAIKQVLNSLDRVAFLTQPCWIPEELVMPWMQPMIIKAWEKLEPYVKHERERRNEPYYYERAAGLADRCRAWRKKNLIETDVLWLEDAL